MFMKNKKTPERQVKFGYKTINETEKDDLVRGVFDSVATKYDFMNDLMSFGAHRLWKDAFITWIRPTSKMKLIDVGGGTGDITCAFLKKGGGNATIVDINRSMLSIGYDRIKRCKNKNEINWINASAENLPIANACYDIYATAFCLRNVTRVERALTEARRVLKPGGRFMCLEFSQVPSSCFEKLYTHYSFKLLPAIGEFVAKDREAYQYLVESIRQFPDQEALSQLMRNAGFKNISYHNLSGGIAAMHSGWRI